VSFRGFIAVEVPVSEPLRRLAEDLRASGASLKIVSLENLHATLKFLGDTDDRLVPDIVGAIRQAAEDVPPFRAGLRGTGAFPSVSRIRVAWIGIEGADPLARIAGRIEASLARSGFRAESRPWSPHVTIARSRDDRGTDRLRQVLRAYEAAEFGEWVVDRILLKRSLLGPEGPTYTTVEDVPLTSAEERA
jgi:2'-5' RNA ligase